MLFNADNTTDVAYSLTHRPAGRMGEAFFENLAGVRVCVCVRGRQRAAGCRAVGLGHSRQQRATVCASGRPLCCLAMCFAHTRPYAIVCTATPLKHPHPHTHAPIIPTGLGWEYKSLDRIHPLQILVLFEAAETQLTDLSGLMAPIVDNVVTPLARLLGFRPHYSSHRSKPARAAAAKAAAAAAGTSEAAAPDSTGHSEL